MIETHVIKEGWGREEGMSLSKACAKGDLEKVAQLIKEGCNIEEQVKYSHRKWKVTDKPVRKCTPLIIASYEGHLAIVRQLISAGANVHAKDGCPGRRRTALHYACQRGYLSIAVILLDNGSRPNEPDDCGQQTPLMSAIAFGHEDIALELISRLSGDDVGVKDSEGHSALYYAHRKTFSKCTESLLSKLDQGGEEDREVIDARSFVEDYKEKILCRACKEGDLDKVKLLIREGYDIEERVEYVHQSLFTDRHTLQKCTPLTIASSEGHVDIVRELLRAEASMRNKVSDRQSALDEPDDDDLTLLIIAARFGHEEVVSELLQRGADIHVKSKKDGRTALHIACEKGHLKCAQLLLDAGSRLNEGDDYDNLTPLLLATYFGHEEVVSELFQRGADIHVKSKKDGRTALHIACEKGHLKCAQLLLDAGSRLNEADDYDNWTSLIIAARFGHEEVVSELLQRRADIHVKSKKHGRTALHIACKTGHLKCAQLLLDAGSRLNETDNCDNFTPLILAAHFGHEEVVLELLQRGVDIHVKSKKHGRTALHIACKTGHLKCAQLLLDAGSRLNEADGYDNWTPLIDAARFGHEEVISELLQRGVDIHVKNKKHGRTALHSACKKGHLKCAQLLLDAGSRLNEADDYDNLTPLILAARFGHEEVVSELLQRGTDIHVKSKKDGHTALHIACEKGHLKCAQLLLDAGSRLNEADNCDNFTPLILAALFGHEEVVSELLQRGADIHVKSKEQGRTALHIACAKGHLKCAQLLLDAESRLNAADDYDNWTPLILAARFGHKEVVSELLQRGADIHAKSKEHGRTALHNACETGHLKCAQLLLDAGSRLNEADNCDNFTPLILVALFGHEEVVSELLQRGADIHVKSKEQGRIALHIACAKGHLKCAQLLLDAESGLNAADDYDNLTPLILAARFGHKEVVSELLQRGADIHVKSKEHGRTALHNACETGHLKCARLLLDAGSRLNEADNCDNFTPLILVALFGHEEVVSELLQRGADIHVKSKEQGRTALHIACAKGHLKCAQLLLDAESGLNEADDYDNLTPLILAARFGHKEIVSELLQRGADIHVKSKEHGRTALHIACEKGHLKCAQLLLDAGSRLNEGDDFGKLTPLILAARFGHKEVVSELLQRGADIHVKSKGHGRTALHNACETGHLKCTQLLLDAGSRLNEADDCDNFTPLILAARFGHEEVVSELLQRGADIHVKSKKDGRTALHIACEKGHLKCAQLLLDAGSRLNEADEYGNTPLHLSIYSYDTVLWLIKRGCNVSAKNEKGLSALDVAPGNIPLGTSLENVKRYYPTMRLLIRAGCSLTLSTVHVGVKQMVKDEAISFKKIICVIGHSGYGKSTLIAALRNEGTSTFGKMIKRWQKVANITERTAGIEPVSFKSQKYGEVIFFDFAGQHDYHGPHQTFLEALVKRPGTTLTVLLLVKATEEEAVMLQQMTRWLQPLSWIIPSSCFIQVTVVGSFADQVKDFQEAKQKIRRCCQSLQNIPNHIFTDSVLLDCRWIHSDGIEEISEFLQQSQVTASFLTPSEDKPYNVHWVLHHLREVNQSALSTDQFSQWLNLSMLHPHLSESDILSLCKDLSSTGHVLFMEQKQDPRKGWLILQLEQILHRVYGTLFTEIAPNMGNRLGLVHVDQIAKILPEFEQDLIMSLISSMDFCHEVDPLLFQSGILPPNKEEGWLFFPSLVMITDRPTTYFPQVDSSSEYKYICWQVNTLRTKFFSPRLLQTILLHLATHQTVFKRDKPSRSEEVSLQVKEHCCILWCNGITWQTTSGVDVVVQLFNNTIAQVIARIPHEVDPSILVNCLSSVAADILRTVNELYPDLLPHLEAYIIDCTDYMELCTNPRCPNLHDKFSILDIASILSISGNDNPFCQSLTNESEHPRYKSIRELFGGFIPSLATIHKMDPHKMVPFSESSTSVSLRLMRNPLTDNFSTDPSVTLEDNLLVDSNRSVNQDRLTSTHLRHVTGRPSDHPSLQEWTTCKCM